MNQDVERKHVQEVYNDIAEHFSNTRYKAWPVVQNFLGALPVGSIGLDCGCGNGKNMRVNDQIICIGLDNSFGLLKLAHKKNNLSSVVACDVRLLPVKSDAFDFAISIAVIHHLSKEVDRVNALKEIIRSLKSGGDFLVFVWAAEQEAIYRTPELELLNNNADYLVPWRSGEKLFKRFYHLFRKGELEKLVLIASKKVSIVESGYDRDNWFVIGKKL